MPNYFTKLTIANASYDIMDVEARELISSLSQALIFVGVTTTVITDGQATPNTYGGLSGITIPSGHTSADTVDTGTVVIYDGHEFVWDGAKWAEFGSTYQWTPVLTKDSVLGENTAFTPSYTVTATTDALPHKHTIDSTNVANLMNQKVLKATLGGNKKLSTINLDTASQTLEAIQNSDGVNTYTLNIDIQPTVGTGTTSGSGTGSSVATGSLEADANGEVYTTIGLEQSANANPGTGEVFWVSGAKYGSGGAELTEETSADGQHNHSYDKDTGITVGANDIVDAVINVTLQ